MDSIILQTQSVTSTAHRHACAELCPDPPSLAGALLEGSSHWINEWQVSAGLH